MASHQLERDKWHSMFEADTPRFFKIILDDAIRDRKLGIPTKFVRSYGDDLPKLVYIKVPSGKVWQVELRKCDGEIWLEKGWQQFSDYYSLEHGNFLVFEYDKNQHFSVLIFDKSATEIDYAFIFGNESKKPNIEKELEDSKVEETKDDVSLEFLDDFSPFQKRKEKSPIGCTQPHKKFRRNSTRKPGSTSDLHISVLPNGSQSSGKKLKSVTHAAKKGDCLGANRSKGEGSSRRFIQKPICSRAPWALDADKKLASKPAFFEAPIRSYHLKYSNMAVPMWFILKYIKESSESIILQVANRCWSLKLIRYPRVGQGKLTAGWRKFATENCLHVGDVCVFEATESDTTQLKVSIFKGDRGGANQVNGAEDKEGAFSHFIYKSVCPKSPTVKANKKLTSIPQFFRHVIQRQHLENHYMYVPMRFISRYIKESSETIILQVANRRWPVKLNRYPNYSYVRLSAGWSKFARENSLHVGDVCVFEAMKSNNMQLKVSIFRGNANQLTRKEGDSIVQRPLSSKDPAGEEGDSKQHIVQRPPSSKDPVVEGSSKYVSMHAIHRAVMRPYHFSNGVTFPKSFFSQLNRNAESVKLQAQDRKWSVKLSRCQQSGQGKLLSAGGWDTFARDNVLRVGDVCEFEVISCDDVLLKVSIIREVGDWVDHHMDIH